MIALRACWRALAPVALACAVASIWPATRVEADTGLVDLVAMSAAQYCIGTDLSAEAMVGRASQHGWGAFASMAEHGFPERPAVDFAQFSAFEVEGSAVSMQVLRQHVQEQSRKPVEWTQCVLRVEGREIENEVGNALGARFGSGSYEPGSVWMVRVHGGELQTVEDGETPAIEMVQSFGSDTLLVVRIELAEGGTTTLVNSYRLERP